MQDDLHGPDQWWWKYTGKSSHLPDIETLWACQNARLAAMQNGQGSETESLSVGRNAKNLKSNGARIRLLQVGAITALAALLVVGVTTFTKSAGDQTNVASSELESVRTYTTTAGQRATIQLDDGSTVILGNASTLKLSPGFNSTDREVSVIGEAYFTVTNHTTHPFIVRVGKTATRVLGTTFAVRNYAEDTAVRVVVTSGRVSAVHTGSNTPGAVLNAGDLAMLRADGTIAVTRPANLAHLISWTNGMLVFQDAALRDVIPELERFYGVTIKVETPSLLTRRVSATFVAGPPSEVLDVLASAIGAKSRYHEKQIVLSSH
jgi:ferric-dicitrate binding protein FerR (iron transport regulator)